MRLKGSVLTLLALALVLSGGHAVLAGSLQQVSDGPVAVVGTFGSDNFAVTPDLFPEATIALVDARNIIGNVQEEWLPDEGQILGYATTPLFPTPSKYRIDLPIVPAVSPLDLDNDGEEDTGVQVFYLIVASNLIGDSYLQQLEQIGGLGSFLTNPLTGAITEADLLVFAQDDDQAFPSAFGADGIWFTGDDAAEPLEAGYTVVRLADDGTSSRDRSAEVTIDTKEEAERASADFSDQGILESFNSLIDHLSARYAWTDLRGLDWEEIRANYLPEVEEADANEDYNAYFVTLNTLALSLQDAHVSAFPGSFDQFEAAEAPIDEEYAATVGASVANISDPANPDTGPGENFIVISVGDDSPAAEAGWIPGTEIVTIDGQTPMERLDSIPLTRSVGTAESARIQRMIKLMQFPENAEITFEYRLPDSDEIETTTMTTGFYATSNATRSFSFSPFPITLEQVDFYTVMQWGDFLTAAATKIAVVEEALAIHQGMDTGGLIIDMRGNSGGWGELYEMIASYFYTADDPMPVQLFDSWSYDFDESGFVREASVDYEISAPKPELAYTGPLVILINEYCASACEYFTQTLQETGRATVIGQHASTGAGGPIDVVSMPGEITFQYTVGRTTFAGTEEPNIEAKGVVPDIRVPITVETEAAKQAGEDPVLDAAIAYLDEVNAELMATPEPIEASPEATPAA